MFPTMFSKHKPVYHHSGSRFKNEYRLKILENGADDLESVGMYDLYADIQSHKESCDINFILERFRRTGDESLLHAMSGVYMDITGMPKTYAEMLQLSADAERAFYSLKPEVRAEFDHNPNVFFASLGSEKAQEIFAKFSGVDVSHETSSEVIDSGEA